MSQPKVGSVKSLRVAPADDVAVRRCARPRVGGVDAAVRVLVPAVPRAVLLVSVAIAVSDSREGVDPLGAVHLRGADERRPRRAC